MKRGNLVGNMTRRFLPSAVSRQSNLDSATVLGECGQGEFRRTVKFLRETEQRDSLGPSRSRNDAAAAGAATVNERLCRYAHRAS